MRLTTDQPQYSANSVKLYGQLRLEAMREVRLKFEGSFRYTNSTDSAGEGIWGLSLVGLGLAAGISMVVMYCYTAATHGLTIPGYIFAMNLGSWLVTGLLQLASYQLRKTSLTKLAIPEHKEGDQLFYACIEFAGGYYASAAALALGYFCTSLVAGGALSLELAAIGGAITGGIIALPSIFIGPSSRLQGHIARFDIISSAAAGAAALMTAKIVADLFFTHMGIALDKLAPEMACLMHITIALPVFAAAKILISTVYESFLGITDNKTGASTGGNKRGTIDGQPGWKFEI